MNGNFDYDTNPNDSTEELIPFWEQYELDYVSNSILEAEHRWYDAIAASDFVWETYPNELHTIVREAEEILAEYGIIPNFAQLDVKFN